MQRQGLRGSTGDRIDPQWQPDLIQIRQELKSGALDLNAVINRLVKLTQRVVGAGGAGVWLFANNEIFYSAGAGNASNDEGLRLRVISKLAISCQPNRDSQLLGEPTASDTLYDASDRTGCAESLLVEPVYQGHNVAGALAVFSDELNAFTERDAANIRVLADVLAQALSKAAEAGQQQSVALEPPAMLQLIERMIPALQRMLERDENPRPSRRNSSQSAPQRELPTAGRDTIPLEASLESWARPRVTEAIARTGAEPEQAAPAPPLEDTEDTYVARIGVWAALKSKLAEASTLWPLARQASERTVAFVGAYTSRTVKWLRLKLLGLSNRIQEAGHQVWRTARHSSDSPPGATKTAHGLQEGLRQARDLFQHAWKVASTRLQMLLQSRPSLRAPLTAASVLGVFVITITFFMLKTGLHKPARSTASSSPTTNTIPLRAPKSDAPEAHGAEQFGTSAPLPVSHLHVTDRATEAAVRTLSRYELAGLRRQAEYGDDSAAFQLGMAYEIGRGVPQRCATAAQWVARAADEGNAAAQYNLGLRYRDGDGVAVDEGEAVKWLQKAAAQQTSNAQLALGALTAPQARVMPSSQTSH
jgi:hypothetical protein